MPRTTAAYLKEFSASQAAIQSEVSEYAIAIKARQVQRVRELDGAFERKKKEKQGKFDELKRKHEAELANRPMAVLTPREAAKDGNPHAAELKEFEAQKAKLSMCLQFVSTQIDGLMAEGERALAKFNNELSSIDKLKRQLQRRIETEARGIDDEYERKIQVEQVNLQKSIENISKLYDEDENRRGREVIEWIRKVRQSRNRVDDFLKRKRKELESLERDNRNSESSVRHEIARLKNKNQESEIREKLKALEGTIARDIRSSEASRTQEVAKLTGAITALRTENEAAKLAIETATQARLKEINDELGSVFHALEAVERTKAEELSRIQARYNKRAEDFARVSDSEVEKMRKRIELAEQRKREMEQELEGVYAHQQEQFAHNIEAKASEIWKSILVSVSSARQKSQALDAEIATLWQTKMTMEEAFVDLPRRKEEQARIGILETEIASQTAEISSKFESLVWLLSHGPTEPQERSKTAIPGKSSLGKIPLQSLPSLL
jgi:hypothetical protein